jgi:hypothetical protein
MDNPINQEALDNFNDAVDLSRVLLSNANALKKSYSESSKILKDSSLKSIYNVMSDNVKTLNNLLIKQKVMSEDMLTLDVSKARVMDSQKKLLEQIEKIRVNDRPLIEEQLNLTNEILKAEKEKYETLKRDYNQSRYIGLLGEEALDNLREEIQLQAEKVRHFEKQSELESNSLHDMYDMLGTSILQAETMESYVNNWTAASAKIGIAGKLLKGISKIPIFGDLVNADKALKAMTLSALNGGGLIKNMAAGISEIFKGGNWMFAVLEAAYQLGKFFIGAMLKGDELTTRITRTLSITKQEAGQIKYYMSAIKNDLGDQLFTTEDMVKALEELNQLNGASMMYSKEMLHNQTTLTKQVGLQADEASRINELLSVNSDYTGQLYSNIEKTRAKFAGTNGIIINTKKLLTDVSKISSQIFINFRGNTDNLLKAAMRAEQLGTNLEKVRDISSSLLSFESSIESELEAELLTGRELNFERARALSLQGDYAGVLEEINKNVGTYNNFQKMNVIQQEAISKAFGMSSDDMSNMLLKQKFITQENKKYLNDLVTGGKIKKAQDLEAMLMKGANMKEAERSLNAQEKFNIALEKAQEIIGDKFSGEMLNNLSDAVVSFTNAVNKIANSKIVDWFFGGNISEKMETERQKEFDGKLKGIIESSKNTSYVEPISNNNNKPISKTNSSSKDSKSNEEVIKTLKEMHSTNKELISYLKQPFSINIDGQRFDSAIGKHRGINEPRVA